MARIKLDFPSPSIFKTAIKVRITDLNYGGHLGNDSLLSLMHDARVQFFNFLGASELDFFGNSVIMSDVAIQYKGEGFAGDELIFEMTMDDFASKGFDVWYKIFKIKNEIVTDVAIAKTGIVCYNYEEHKTKNVPEKLIEKIAALKATA